MKTTDKEVKNYKRRLKKVLDEISTYQAFLTVGEEYLFNTLCGQYFMVSKPITYLDKTILFKTKILLNNLKSKHIR